MGTRAYIKIRDLANENIQEILVYKHFDGYPTAILSNFLKALEIFFEKYSEYTNITASTILYLFFVALHEEVRESNIKSILDIYIEKEEKAVAINYYYDVKYNYKDGMNILDIDVYRVRLKDDKKIKIAKVIIEFTKTEIKNIKMEAYYENLKELEDWEKDIVKEDLKEIIALTNY